MLASVNPREKNDCIVQTRERRTQSIAYAKSEEARGGRKVCAKDPKFSADLGPSYS